MQKTPGDHLFSAYSPPIKNGDDPLEHLAEDSNPFLSKNLG